MNKDYYTLKEIVFGLRNEQLRIIEKLIELEKYVNISDNSKCKSFKLTINNTKELGYKFLYQTNNLLEKIFLFISGEYREAVKGVALPGIVRKDENGKYIFGDKITINNENQESFDMKVDELLKDEFIQNIFHNFRVNEMSLNETSHVPILSLKYDSTIYFNANPPLSNKAKYERIKYSARENLMYILNDNHNILELLSSKIPRNLIPEYYQNIIDTNDNAKKDILIPDTRIYGRKASFYVNEESNAFVLVKKTIPTKK